MNELKVSKFYKFNLISNFLLTNENKININNEKNIKLIINLSNIAKKEKISINDNNDGEFIIESPIASYSIKNNLICAKSDSIDKIINTIYNLPSSIIALNNNDILLHASSVEFNGQIYAFCGEKGTGKSTFISYITKKYNFFSDDAIYLESFCDEEIRCYSPNGFIKICTDVIEKHNVSFFSEHKKICNYNNKVVYEKISKCNNDSFYYLKKIFILKRKKIDSFYIRKVTTEYEKNMLLLDNIVGSKYIPKNLILKMIKSDIYQNIYKSIDFYYLVIKDDLEFLSKNYELICNTIFSNI